MLIYAHEVITLRPEVQLLFCLLLHFSVLLLSLYVMVTAKVNHNNCSTVLFSFPFHKVFFVCLVCVCVCVYVWGSFCLVFPPIVCIWASLIKETLFCFSFAFPSLIHTLEITFEEALTCKRNVWSSLNLGISKMCKSMMCKSTVQI